MPIVTLGIEGMTCGGCVSSITRVLQGLDGVAKADVSLEKKCAIVDYDPARVGLDQLKRSVEDAGFEVVA